MEEQRIHQLEAENVALKLAKPKNRRIKRFGLLLPRLQRCLVDDLPLPKARGRCE
jgi:hypothetical protein